MPDLRDDAEYLIKAHDRRAAGVAMSWALDYVQDYNARREEHWLAVAMLVMEMQERQGGTA
jgi:hypothetical protein